MQRELMERRLGELATVLAVVRGWCGDRTVRKLDRMLELRCEVDRLRVLVELDPAARAALAVRPVCETWSPAP